ncbi:Chromosome (plasmid) partitioning protein ParB / Stage 0 sporulation protein J [Pseudonocardia sp. Ae406_Ps2]|uniref:ParB/RepB/Spo0J family partition protein n=1 Tax=unclassified Pseudonocardia TaxID=2619320 RepID=UPI00094B2EA4|nr:MULTISPECIES: ParB/RepB/Spo0J family partition protein [unclassified Pseudonocardia]OLL89691.1 Chromosome (plasmid) partitioning protein ParB / Stage 0 sporulation protein J [Pseudonocardia sp. Ae331_Ps2]OLL96320.1 Chromosome (plasmid) partitioning protein ParB / Stage 0 sporulation protein J [Pseudonocardia sp. Ae406_Ps2]OLM08499.1 Chromosome (plasmid) partitioning protein ParB / Stage 0 sporulation protein J [Pseudonocardia sp. Ae505_Ps2]OLM09640.1 Chromosome (plasmid) partitioning protein
MSEVAASASDSGVGAPAKKRKRGRVSFSSDVFAEETSLHALADGGASQRRIPLSDLAHNPRNPRYGYDDSAIEELADSLREHHQLQPATVVARDVYLAHYPEDADQLGTASWVVLIGNRRLAAAHLAGLTHLVASVEDRLGGADPMLAEATLVENIHRQDLPPLLEARELQGLVERHGSQRAAAKRVAKTQAWVSQRLSLLKLTPELQEQLRAGELSVKEARTVASVPAEEQAEKLKTLRDKPPAVEVVTSSAGADADAEAANGSSSPVPASEPGARDEAVDVDKIARRLRRQLDDDGLEALIGALTALRR